MYRFLLYFLTLNAVHCSCPAGFDLIRDGQCRGYYGTRNIIDNVATETAIAKCNELHAQPVTIHTSEEQTYWKNQGTTEKRFLLLGLTCNTTSLRWQWMDGSDADYKPTEGTSPSGELDRNCAAQCVWVQYYDGIWHKWCDTDSDPFDIYCIKNLGNSNPSPDGCNKFDDDADDGVCYQIGTTAESWSDAQLICKKLGANLASVHNTNENAFIRRLAVSKGAVHGVFLGATISGKGGNFGWIDGSAWDYENFYPGFPMSVFGDCVALDTSVLSGQWMNMDCTSRLPVVCVREQGAAVEQNITCNIQTWDEGTIITSPGFPYNASIPCDFYLAVEEGKKVEVEIVHLEANTCCDSLVLYDGYFGGYVLATLTGDIHNATYTTSDSNFMRVSWLPNGGVNVMGMAITFRGV